MATPSQPPTTAFTRDVIGRYVCNGLDEELASTTGDAEARPFDTVVIGAGSFGSVLAARLARRDVTAAHRILVLDAGPYVYPEHVQNLPPRLDAGEVWGVPWNSDSPKPWNQRFPGLAYCLGGRSVFWGGWSPYFTRASCRRRRGPRASSTTSRSRWSRPAVGCSPTSTTQPTRSARRRRTTSSTGRCTPRSPTAASPGCRRGVLSRYRRRAAAVGQEGEAARGAQSGGA